MAAIDTDVLEAAEKWAAARERVTAARKAESELNRESCRLANERAEAERAEAAAWKGLESLRTART